MSIFVTLKANANKCLLGKALLRPNGMCIFESKDHAH